MAPVGPEIHGSLLFFLSTEGVRSPLPVGCLEVLSKALSVPWGKALDLDWVWFLALPLISFVIMGKFFNLRL